MAIVHTRHRPLAGIKELDAMSKRQWRPALHKAVTPWLSRAYGTLAPARHDEKRDGFDALVASWNIHKCIGLDGIFDPDRTLAVIAELGADLLALQEVDKRFGARSGLLDMRALHDECGLVPIPLRPTGKGHGWHGNLVLCREGLVRSARQMALPGVEARGALIVDLEMTAGPLRLVAAHLGLLRHSRARQVQAILAAIATDPETPTLLAGDLNEWRLGPRSSLLGLSQAFGVSAPPMPTFPADYPVLALDRLMANQHGMLAHATVHHSPLSRLASDHLPLKAWVKLPGKDADRA
jgi:endonuclease/exonuclease/phosphatase family metal-dependent hydrolase